MLWSICRCMLLFLDGNNRFGHDIMKESRLTLLSISAHAAFSQYSGLQAR
jgi:hypothetical protein